MVDKTLLKEIKEIMEEKDVFIINNFLKQFDDEIYKHIRNYNENDYDKGYCDALTVAKKIILEAMINGD